MPQEIERKFIISHLPDGIFAAQDIRQAYLQAEPARSVRVRIASRETGNTDAYITIKGPAAAEHFTRAEFEYQIPPTDAEALLRLCDHEPIHKTRYLYKHGGHKWELDVFRASNTGLLIGEVELASEKENVPLPDFVLQEVTHDKRYFNLSLAYHPFSTWQH